MHIISIEWIAFACGCLGGYWLLPARFRDHWVIVVTALFLYLFDARSLAILAFEAGLVCVIAAGAKRSRSTYVATAVAMVAVLVYYKLQVAGAAGGMMESLIIPLGLSYYTFRCLHYLLEHARGNARATDPFSIFAYLFFLPTILIGPIHRSGAFFDDMRSKQWSAEDLSRGMERILYGYVKVAVLGDALVSAWFGDVIRGIDPANEALVHYCTIVRNGLNLYFQFSGFSDVAIGLSLMLGYRVMENFNFPYLQRNIGDFWRCWHISLTSWTRDYVYLPTLGITRQPYVATCSTFVVIGLWHGLSPGYLAWGIYHAAGVILWQRWQITKRRLRLPRVEHPVARRLLNAASIVATVHFVWFGFVLVNQPDLASAFRVYATMLLFWTGG